MQAKRDFKVWLPVQPGHMRAGFPSFKVKILAIEIDAVHILTAVERKAGGIQTRAKPDVQTGGPLILLQQFADG